MKMGNTAIAFYNTENFFDYSYDGEKHNNEFTPEGSRKWTKKRYENKVGKVAAVISEIGKRETGAPPLFIGLAEIENDKVLNDLIHSDHLEEFGYRYVHYESLDERGIDNAILYRENLIRLIHSEPLRFTFPEGADSPQDFTRDILYVQFELNQSTVHTFVLHLPSRRDTDVNRDFRNLILNKVRGKANEILRENPAAYVILMGDFNGNPDDKDAHSILQTTDSLSLNENDFFNPMFRFKHTKGSLKHEGRWILFDQILFSKAFFKEGEMIIRFQSAEIYNDHSVQEWDRRFKGSPFRTFAGTKYLGGYSDHFPVYAVLNY